ARLLQMANRSSSRTLLPWSRTAVSRLCSFPSSTIVRSGPNRAPTPFPSAPHRLPLTPRRFRSPCSTTPQASGPVIRVAPCRHHYRHSIRLLPQPPCPPPHPRPANPPHPPPNVLCSRIQTSPASPSPLPSPLASPLPSPPS